MDISSLLEKINTGSLNVVVVGGGYVGLPLAISAHLAGYKVTILDTDPQKVDGINKGERPEDFPDCPIKATLDPSCQSNADVVLICVPTPINNDNTPALNALSSALNTFRTFCPMKPCLLCIESTVYPGYTDSIMESSLFHDVDNIVFAFSSERINPGTLFSELHNIPKVVGVPDKTEKSLSIACSFYKKLFKTVIPVSSSTEAEFSKLLENSFRAVNIALVNEFAIVCHKLGVDIREVIEAASTKPFGFTPFSPGPGVGGHCVPVDSYYLLWEGCRNGITMPLLEQAMRVNKQMPSYIVSRVREIDNIKDILVIGVSYKKDVPDLRESPALNIIKELDKYSYNVFYCDPLVPQLSLDNGKEMRSANLDRSFDAGIIVAEHSVFDWEQILENCSVVFDTRGVLSHLREEKIIRL